MSPEPGRLSPPRQSIALIIFRAIFLMGIKPPNNTTPAINRGFLFGYPPNKPYRIKDNPYNRNQNPTCPPTCRPTCHIQIAIRTNIPIK